MILTGSGSKWSNMDHLEVSGRHETSFQEWVLLALPHIPEDEVFAKGSVALGMWLWQWLPVPKRISGCRKSRYLVRLGQNSGLIFWLRFGASQCVPSPLRYTVISRTFGSSCWQGILLCAVMFALQHPSRRAHCSLSLVERLFLACLTLSMYFSATQYNGIIILGSVLRHCWSQKILLWVLNINLLTAALRQLDTDRR